MTTLREAAQQALEALESAVEYDYHGTPLTEAHAGFDDAATALKAALAEPVQEQPICDECGRKKADGWALYCVDCVEPMFAAPQRKPLTEEEIYGMYSEPSSDAEMVEFARAIEAAHGIT